MVKRNIDLSDIKEKELDKTASFNDLMTRSERKRKNNDIDDIEAMVNEKRKSSKSLYKNEDMEENLGKTQILELTRQMKFNFEEKKEENIEKKKTGISILNVIGEVNLLCIGYYIYLLTFTNYQDDQIKYIFTGGIIILLVLLFGLSVVTTKKLSKFFNILNILVIILFILFNIYTLLY